MVVMENVYRTPCPQDDTLTDLNMRLKNFEILLQLQFAPHRDLVREIEEDVKAGRWPKEYWKALLVGLRGGGFVELTYVRNQRVLIPTTAQRRSVSVDRRRERG